eukprot:TRINITY_DN19251_c0_g1_i1.p1 TRINITY_DN19251_c0_g1~~TRINITY_DN19251_c0_g1_i1.p1  ORF type:complete len:2787 (+),score=992.16 TRINITY_DN19251_c0_g1_i1:60-8363(+)
MLRAMLAAALLLCAEANVEVGELWLYGVGGARISMTGAAAVDGLGGSAAAAIDGNTESSWTAADLTYLQITLATPQQITGFTFHTGEHIDGSGDPIRWWIEAAESAADTRLPFLLHQSSDVAPTPGGPFPTTDLRHTKEPTNQAVFTMSDDSLGRAYQKIRFVVTQTKGTILNRLSTGWWFIIGVIAGIVLVVLIAFWLWRFRDDTGRPPIDFLSWEVVLCVFGLLNLVLTWTDVASDYQAIVLFFREDEEWAAFVCIGIAVVAPVLRHPGVYYNLCVLLRSWGIECCASVVPQYPWTPQEVDIVVDDDGPELCGMRGCWWDWWFQLQARHWLLCVFLDALIPLEQTLASVKFMRLLRAMPQPLLYADVHVIAQAQIVQLVSWRAILAELPQATVQMIVYLTFFHGSPTLTLLDKGLLIFSFSISYASVLVAVIKLLLLRRPYHTINLATMEITDETFEQDRGLQFLEALRQPWMKEHVVENVNVADNPCLHLDTVPHLGFGLTPDAMRLRGWRTRTQQNECSPWDRVVTFSLRKRVQLNVCATCFGADHDEETRAFPRDDEDEVEGSDEEDDTGLLRSAAVLVGIGDRKLYDARGHRRRTQAEFKERYGDEWLERWIVAGLEQQNLKTSASELRMRRREQRLEHLPYRFVYLQRKEPVHFSNEQGQEQAKKCRCYADERLSMSTPWFRESFYALTHRDSSARTAPAGSDSGLRSGRRVSEETALLVKRGKLVEAAAQALAESSHDFLLKSLAHSAKHKEAEVHVHVRSSIDACSDMCWVRREHLKHLADCRAVRNSGGSVMSASDFFSAGTGYIDSEHIHRGTAVPDEMTDGEHKAWRILKDLGIWYLPSGPCCVEGTEAEKKGWPRVDFAASRTEPFEEEAVMQVEVTRGYQWWENALEAERKREAATLGINAANVVGAQREAIVCLVRLRQERLHNFDGEDGDKQVYCKFDGDSEWVHGQVCGTDRSTGRPLVIPFLEADASQRQAETDVWDDVIPYSATPPRIFSSTGRRVTPPRGSALCPGREGDSEAPSGKERWRWVYTYYIQYADPMNRQRLLLKPHEGLLSPLVRIRNLTEISLPFESVDLAGESDVVMQTGLAMASCIREIGRMYRRRSERKVADSGRRSTTCRDAAVQLRRIHFGDSPLHPKWLASRSQGGCGVGAAMKAMLELDVFSSPQSPVQVWYLIQDADQHWPQVSSDPLTMKLQWSNDYLRDHVENFFQGWTLSHVGRSPITDQLPRWTRVFPSDQLRQECEVRPLKRQDFVSNLVTLMEGSAGVEPGVPAFDRTFPVGADGRLWDRSQAALPAMVLVCAMGAVAGGRDKSPGVLRERGDFRCSDRGVFLDSRSAVDDRVPLGLELAPPLHTRGAEADVEVSAKTLAGLPDHPLYKQRYLDAPYDGTAEDREKRAQELYGSKCFKAPFAKLQMLADSQRFRTKGVPMRFLRELMHNFTANQHFKTFWASNMETALQDISSQMGDDWTPETHHMVESFAEWMSEIRSSPLEYGFPAKKDVDEVLESSLSELASRVSMSIRGQFMTCGDQGVPNQLVAEDEQHPTVFTTVSGIDFCRSSELRRYFSILPKIGHEYLVSVDAVRKNADSAKSYSVRSELADALSILGLDRQLVYSARGRSGSPPGQGPKVSEEESLVVTIDDVQIVELSKDGKSVKLLEEAGHWFVEVLWPDVQFKDLMPRQQSPVPDDVIDWTGGQKTEFHSRVMGIFRVAFESALTFNVASLSAPELGAGASVRDSPLPPWLRLEIKRMYFEAQFDLLTRRKYRFTNYFVSVDGKEGAEIAKAEMERLLAHEQLLCNVVLHDRDAKFLACALARQQGVRTLFCSPRGEQISPNRNQPDWRRLSQMSSMTCLSDDADADSARVAMLVPCRPMSVMLGHFGARWEQPCQRETEWSAERDVAATTTFVLAHTGVQAYLDRMRLRGAMLDNTGMLFMGSREKFFATWDAARTCGEKLGRLRLNFPTACHGRIERFSADASKLTASFALLSPSQLRKIESSRSVVVFLPEAVRAPDDRRPSMMELGPRVRIYKDEVSWNEAQAMTEENSKRYDQAVSEERAVLHRAGEYTTSGVVRRTGSFSALDRKKLLCEQGCKPVHGLLSQLNPMKTLGYFDLGIADDNPDRQKLAAAVDSRTWETFVEITGSSIIHPELSPALGKLGWERNHRLRDPPVTPPELMPGLKHEPDALLVVDNGTIWEAEPLDVTGTPQGRRADYGPGRFEMRLWELQRHARSTKARTPDGIPGVFFAELQIHFTSSLLTALFWWVCRGIPLLAIGRMRYNLLDDIPGAGPGVLPEDTGCDLDRWEGDRLTGVSQLLREQLDKRLDPYLDRGDQGPVLILATRAERKSVPEPVREMLHRLELFLLACLSHPEEHGFDSPAHAVRTLRRSLLDLSAGCCWSHTGFFFLSGAVGSPNQIVDRKAPPAGETPESRVLRDSVTFIFASGIDFGAPLSPFHPEQNGFAVSAISNVIHDCYEAAFERAQDEGITHFSAMILSSPRLERDLPELNRNLLEEIHVRKQIELLVDEDWGFDTFYLGLTPGQVKRARKVLDEVVAPGGNGLARLSHRATSRPELQCRLVLHTRDARFVAAELAQKAAEPDSTVKAALLVPCDVRSVAMGIRGGSWEHTAHANRDGSQYMRAGWAAGVPEGSPGGQDSWLAKDWGLEEAVAATTTVLVTRGRGGTGAIVALENSSVSQLLGCGQEWWSDRGRLLLEELRMKIRMSSCFRMLQLSSAMSKASRLKANSQETEEKRERR